jgi:hypothetical protein
MKTLELNDLCLSELNSSEHLNIEGGVVLGFNWGMFWKGCGIGLGIGATAGTAAYIAYA